MSVYHSLIKKSSQTNVEMYDKDILFCFRLSYVSPNALSKQQLWADLACIFIECCPLMNGVIKFHESFPSRTE